jgi:hypothetical protein
VEGADLIAGWLAKKWAKDSGAYAAACATWISALLFDHLLSRMAEIHKPRHRKWPRRLSWVARFVTEITPRASCSFRYSAARADNLPCAVYTLPPRAQETKIHHHSYIQIHFASLCLFDEALINIYPCASCFSFAINSSIYIQIFVLSMSLGPLFACGFIISNQLS